MLRGLFGRTIRRISYSRALSALLLAASLPALMPATAEAKTPGKTYCFNGVCHRVNTLQEMAGLVGKDQTFKTSFYDDCKRDRFNPCGLTSSGEVFRPNDADNAASPIYPNGTVLLLRNPANGQSAVVRVNNAGPYWGKRKLDVSRGTAERLGFKKRGVASLDVRVVKVPTVREAKYNKKRRYDAVPGPIGVFASLERAQGGMVVAMALDAITGSVFSPFGGKVQTALKARKSGILIASADGVTDDTVAGVPFESPADGLKAAARRTYGVERGARRIAPASMTAEIAPIHRSRQQTTVR